jgi:tetratricopeptide (TPR) repeat protein
MTSRNKDQLEIEYHTNPRNIQTLCPLAEIYLAENRLERAGKLVDAALKEIAKIPTPTINTGLMVLDVSLKLWKADRFASRGNVRLNFSSQRRKLLEDINDLCTSLTNLHDRDSFQALSLQTAYVRESMGSYQDTLTILSDLITMQATDGVDLSYIIFKAAILLRHVGHVKQAIEYLEFVFDDPPLQGLNRLHVAAFMAALYENSGEKYRVFLAKAYRDLIAVITDEADPKVHGASAKQYKRLENMTKNPTAFQANAEFWEVMAFQALERCEYVLAAEFLTVAIAKASNKGPMQHYLAEVYWLLCEKEQAEIQAERAYAALPQSAELRNLLLQISPDKWAEKVRFLSPTKTESVSVSNIGDNAIQAPVLSQGMSSSSLLNSSSSTTNQGTTTNRPSSGGLVGRLRNSAASALQVFHQASFRGSGPGSNTSPTDTRPLSPDRPTSAPFPTLPTPIKEEDENEKSVSMKQAPNDRAAGNSQPPSPSKGKQSKYVTSMKPTSSSSSRGRRPIQGKPLKPPPITDPEEKRLLQTIQRGEGLNVRSVLNMNDFGFPSKC